LFAMDVDPCGPTMSATVAQCALTGLPANLYGSQLLDNPAGQYNQLTGGNPNLTPEIAATYTVGVVLQLGARLAATIDYWNFSINSTIGTFDPNLALNQCLTTGQLCNAIHRDALGTLWLSSGGYVDATNVNIGSTKTDGIDVTVNYTYSFEKYGSLAFAFTGTWVNAFITQQAPGLQPYNCAGFYGSICGTPLPQWRNVLQVTWNTPWSWNAGLRWRYFDSVSIDASSSNPVLASDFDPVTGKIGAQSYLDLFAQWNINKNFTLRAGVNNVFDHDPPLVSPNIGGPPYGNGNGFPQAYDTLGRNIFINIQAKF
jgi:iron complex outermembrane receptor protein